MSWLFAFVGLGVIVGIAAVSSGAGGSLRTEPEETAGPELPGHPMRAEDVSRLRFAVALRGYRMDQVDRVLDRLTEELRDRDERIAAYERASDVPVGLTGPVVPAARVVPATPVVPAGPDASPESPGTP